MNPAFQAAEVYRLEPCSHTFYEALDYYLAHGWVHSTPDFFVMGRPVCSDWAEEVIINPMLLPQSELTQRPDTWHIALMAGDLKAACCLLPYDLPFISFERKNQLRFHRHDRLFPTIRKRSLSLLSGHGEDGVVLQRC